MNRAARVRAKIGHFHARTAFGTATNASLRWWIQMPDGYRNTWTVARSRLSRAKFWRV